jgi:hypothetical protein
MSAFESKILRKTYGPTEERGEYRIRYNKELYQLYRLPDVIISIRIYRLRWAGQVERMSGEYILRRIMDCKPERRRRIERPKVR